MDEQVAPSNADEYRAWNGEQGRYWTDRAQRFDEGVAAYHERLLDAAAIGSHEHVLDIGCGSGTTTRDAARRATAGSALGVDLSGPMLGLARARAEAEQLANVTFRHADAQVHPFPDGAFDIAISRNGVMFFGDTAAAFANIARALHPEGRLALLAWQPEERNEWIGRLRAVAAAAANLELSPLPREGPSPVSLSDPDAVRALLGGAGFVDIRIRDTREPMYLGRDTDDAAEFVSGQWATGMLRDLDADARARTVAALRADLAEHRTGEGVRYGSAAWLVEARRR